MRAAVPDASGVAHRAGGNALRDTQARIGCTHVGAAQRVAVHRAVVHRRHIHRRGLCERRARARSPRASTPTRCRVPDARPRAAPRALRRPRASPCSCQCQVVADEVGDPGVVIQIEQREQWSRPACRSPRRRCADPADAGAPRPSACAIPRAWESARA